MSSEYTHIAVSDVYLQVANYKYTAGNFGPVGPINPGGSHVNTGLFQ